MATKDFKNAKACFKKAAQMDPDYPGARLGGGGRARAGRGRWAGRPRFAGGALARFSHKFLSLRNVRWPGP